MVELPEPILAVRSPLMEQCGVPSDVNHLQKIEALQKSVDELKGNHDHLKEEVVQSVKKVVEENFTMNGIMTEGQMSDTLNKHLGKFSEKLEKFTGKVMDTPDESQAYMSQFHTSGNDLPADLTLAKLLHHWHRPWGGTPDRPRGRLQDMVASHFEKSKRKKISKLLCEMKYVVQQCYKQLDVSKEQVQNMNGTLTMAQARQLANQIEVPKPVRRVSQENRKRKSYITQDDKLVVRGLAQRWRDAAKSAEASES